MSDLSHGYETMSVSIAPGVSSLAFWVAQMILDGKKVPPDLTVPFLQIDQATPEASIATTEKGGVANVEYWANDAAKVVGGIAESLEVVVDPRIVVQVEC